MSYTAAQREQLKEYLAQYGRERKTEHRLAHRLEQITGSIRGPLAQEGASIVQIVKDCESRLQEKQEAAQKSLLAVLDALSCLPEGDERTVLEMHYIDGLSWREIREELAFSERKTYMLSTNGLERLWDCKRVRELVERKSNKI